MNDQQRTDKVATERWPHLLIRASAGAGKTFQLSNRYLDLLASGVRGEHILATTFTRKAAGEILDRILYRLAKAATDDKERQALAKQLRAGTLTPEACLALLAETTRNLHRLRVSTLDSFFISIAGSFSLELGLPSGWTIVDEAIDRDLREQAIAETLDDDDGARLLTLYHRLAKGATARGVQRMVQDTVDNLYNVYLEAPPDAWRQLQLTAGLSPEELNQVIEDLASAALSDKRMAKTRDESVELARAGQWAKFIDKGLPAKLAAGDDKYYGKTIPPEVVGPIQRIFDHIPAVLLAPVIAHNEATFELLDSFHAIYERYKRQQQALRFEDVTRHVARATALASLDRLQHRLDGGLAHLLLDEFQDTSLSQWQVLRPFAHKITSATEASSFFCVGDVKQAIYGWRGGLAQIFDALERELVGLENAELAKSFRSSPPVIETVNTIFANLTRHSNLGDYEAPIRAWTERFPRHDTERTTYPGYACLCTLPAEPEGDGDASGDDAEDSGSDFIDRYVAEYIAALHRTSPGMEIGVLVRKNDSVRRLIFALREIGIEASEEGGNPLTDSAAVNLLLSLLRLADHPGDTVARHHLATSPLARELQLTSHQDEAGAVRAAHELRREILTLGHGSWALRWAKLLAPHCNRREMSRLDQMVELAYRYRPSDPLRADAFIAQVELERVSDPTAAPIRVMNVHQSKGLQFDIVVLPELDAGLVNMPDAFATGRPGPTESVNVVCRHVGKELRQFLPERFQQMFEAAKAEHLREALCVLYVAVTRAVYALHMLIDAKKAAAPQPQKTFAGLLRGALCENRILGPEEVAYECGQRDWYDRLRLPATAQSRVTPPLPAPLAIALRPVTDGRQRGWQSVSPSQLEGGPTLRMQDVLRPARQGGEDYGTLMHTWLAHYTWLHDSAIDDETLHRIALDEAHWPGDPAPQIQQLRQRLAEPILQQILDENTYSAAYLKAFPHLGLSTAAQRRVICELRFAQRDAQQLTTGSIDRLVLWQEAGKIVAADILDYKTDALPPGDAGALAAKVEHYRPQLAAYVRAVEQRYQLGPDRITARLLFLSAGEVVDVSPHTKAKLAAPAERTRP